jgi:tetratricopeptide (TPR) repeat protein
MRNGSRRSRKQIICLSKFLECFADIDRENLITSFELDNNNADLWVRLGVSLSNQEKSEEAIETFNKAIELNPNDALAYKQRGYVYSETNETDKAIEDYTKAIELDEKCNAKKYLLHSYRDIKNQFDKAEEIFNTIDFPENVKWLEQTLFELHKRNEGIAREYLLKALHFVENGLTKDTQTGWTYFAAIAVKLGYGQWLLNILEEKEFNIILSPYYVAIQALEIEKTKNAETAEIYLKNQAIEKSDPARIIIEKMTRYV